MDSIENCWKCGQTNHHRPACPNNPPIHLSVVIKKACKRAQRMVSKSETRYNTNPEDITFPIDLLRMALETGENNYYEKLVEIEELGSLQLLDPQMMVELFRKSNELNCQIAKYRELDTSLIPISKMRLRGLFMSKEESDDFKLKIVNFEDLRTKVWQTSCATNMKFLDAASTSKIFWNRVNQLNQLIDGRPAILDNHEVVLLKEKLETISIELVHMLHICHPYEVPKVRRAHDDLKTQILQLELQFLTIKNENLIEEVERLNNMITCGICYDRNVNWSFICGHLICNICLQRLAVQECPICRGVFNIHPIFLN